MTRIREKQLQKRKEETLEVAMKLLFERGYANLNMDELAEEIGISKPTLYQDFNSKDELVSQVILRMYEKLEEELDDLADKSPLDQLEHFLRVMLKSRSEKRHIMAQMDTELRRSFVQRYPHIKEHLAATRSRVSQLITKAQEQGAIDPALPPWVVVNTLFSLTGVINNPFTREEPPRSSEELDEAMECVVCFFRRGVGPDVPIKSVVPDLLAMD
jgi:AcrR family transcriptional regulator